MEDERLRSTYRVCETTTTVDLSTHRYPARELAHVYVTFYDCKIQSILLWILPRDGRRHKSKNENNETTACRVWSIYFGAEIAW